MLSYYIGDPSTRKLTTAHLESPDTKFCTLMMILGILMLTCLTLFLKRDVNEQYFINAFVEQQFMTPQVSDPNR
jgi:hypothetical protein